MEIIQKVPTNIFRSFGSDLVFLLNQNIIAKIEKQKQLSKREREGHWAPHLDLPGAPPRPRSWPSPPEPPPSPTSRQKDARGTPGVWSPRARPPPASAASGRLHECHGTSPTPSHFSLALWTSLPLAPLFPPMAEYAVAAARCCHDHRPSLALPTCSRAPPRRPHLPHQAT